MERRIAGLLLIAVVFTACTNLKPGVPQAADAGVGGSGDAEPGDGAARAGSGGTSQAASGGAAAATGGGAARGTGGKPAGSSSAGSGGDGARGSAASDAGSAASNAGSDATDAGSAASNAGRGAVAGSSGSGGSGSGGMAAGSGGAGGGAASCVPGSEDCECDNGGCNSNLACVAGMCTSKFCGNGATDSGEECDDGNADDTDACTQGCLNARCGDGFVRAGVEECDDANPADSDSCSNACKKHYNVAFVTSTTYSVPSLGGIAGADTACQARATAGGLSGRFVAWISDATTSLTTRLKGARGWVRPDGKPFLDGAGVQEPTYFPPRVTELGTTIDSDQPPALGGYPGSSSDYQCDDWTNTASGKNFLWGDPTGGAGAWNNATFTGCGSTFRLYCFQNEFTNALTFAKASGRLAFVSNQPWASGGGVASADARCNADAQAAGVAGSFKALLATDGASAASRFSTAGAVWVRPDGIPIVAQATDLFVASGVLLAPLQVTAAGMYLLDYGAWSGNADPQQAGTNTCTSWTTNSANLQTVGGRVMYARIPAMLGHDTNKGCDTTYLRLYCLQTP